MSIAIINAKTSWTTHRRNSFEALLSLDGRIRCLGTTAEVLAAREEAVRHYQSSSNASSPFQCEVMDLQHARCVYPGFMDAHAHFMDGGRSMSSLSLRGCKSKANFILAIKAFIVERNLPEGTWVVGGEWSEVDLSAVPTREWLDEATTKHFVFLTRFDLHSAVCSTLALQHAEISASTADPEGVLSSERPTASQPASCGNAPSSSSKRSGPRKTHLTTMRGPWRRQRSTSFPTVLHLCAPCRRCRTATCPILDSSRQWRWRER